VDGEEPKTPSCGDATDGADGGSGSGGIGNPAPGEQLALPLASVVADSAEPAAVQPVALDAIPIETPKDVPAAESTGETPQTTSIAPALSTPDRSQATAGAARRPSRLRALLAVLGGLATIGALVLPFVFRGGGEKPAGIANAASVAGAIAAPGAGGLGVDDAADGGAGEGGDQEDAAPARPATWRVARLADDPTVTIVDGTMGKRPLLVALSSAGLSRSESRRVVSSLQDVRDVDHFDPKDTFEIARDKASGRVVAFEVAGSPVDVWQAREDASPDGTFRLVTRRLELSSERVRIRKSVLVGADLRASFVDAGLSPIDDVLSMLDDALEGHAELSDIRPGARLRIVATLERVDGAFVRWASLDAVEYFPASSSAPPVRVYWFGDDSDLRQGGDHRHGWYDAKGRQPTHGGWRMPIPLARVVSPFNPHRMHPVLHVVMPHNGVDLRASAGTPVYSTAAGTVVGVGNDGPCGNKVEISHPGGISSVYCHLSRFAAGLHVGQHIEGRQLIAYVGQTGRVTGPHLHFGIKKGGQFIDPMTLRMDSVRVVPRARRDDFDRVKASLDGELDGIPLPVAPGVEAPAPKEPSESETFYEEP
jgi:murein DD-endopeptidase MepM/ murein hydrolase activator NlpD